MNALLRVWWTFFTASPLQRWLAGSGVVLGGLLGIAGFAAEESPFWTFGFLAFIILAVFPALFTSAAVFRALSAARANQLRPHFRARMLVAILALEATSVALFATLFFVLAITIGRAMPLEPLIYALAAGTMTFMLMFLVFGDWRFIWLWIGAFVAFIVLGQSARETLAAIPALGWLGATLGAWIAFGIWYMRARRIKPPSFVPQPPSLESAESALGTVTRRRALRVLISGQLPRSQTRVLGRVAGIAIFIVALTSFAPQSSGVVPFTSYIWPIGTAVLLYTNATGVVHRSRLLWLRVPGARDLVRREVEHALLRNLGGAGLLLLGAAALYGSPLLAASPREVLAGLALSVCAGLFGTYAALAATAGNLLQLGAFAVVMVAQFGLLFRTPPALSDVVIVTGIELVGAIAFRVLAIGRWRRVDWLRLRPQPSSTFRNA